MRQEAGRTAGVVRALVALVAAGAAVHVACSGGTPVAPSRAAQRPTVASTGTATAENAPPNIVWRTTPPADTKFDPPIVLGQAPLDVKFNLCNSDDPDQNPTNPGQGDQINWQFNFGDTTSKPPFNADGSFNPDFDHFCRTDHNYANPGRYLATLSVTDEHLEDQAHRVSALARSSQQVLIEVSSDCVPPSSTTIPSYIWACTPPTTFDVSDHFTGVGLRYSATFSAVSPSHHGISEVTGSFTYPPWSIDPATGVISVGVPFGETITVTATNACGSTSQTFFFGSGPL
jgi:hypothetical protein